MAIHEKTILLPDFLDFEVYPFAEFDATQFQGNNQRETLIILSESSQTDEEQQFLNKIMAAVHFNLFEDTVIYFLSQELTIPFHIICQNYDVEKVIFFDTSLKSIGLHLQLPKYQTIHWNGFQLLYVDNLQKISKNKRLKGGLWNALKVMFL